MERNETGAEGNGEVRPTKKGLLNRKGPNFLSEPGMGTKLRGGGRKGALNGCVYFGSFREGGSRKNVSHF